MENKKYELIEDDFIEVDGNKLYRIRALRDFEDVEKGDIGGYIQHEENLSHIGNCWIYDDAMVYENAIVEENASVYDYAKIYGKAWISGNASVCYRVSISGNAQIFGDAEITDYVIIGDNARIFENARVFDYAIIRGHVEVSESATIKNNAIVDKGTVVDGNIILAKDAYIFENFRFASVQGFGSMFRVTTFYLNKDDDILVSCGCFNGTLDEFRNEVRKTHGNSKIAKEYLMIADVMEYRFKHYNKLDIKHPIESIKHMIRWWKY